MGFTGDTHIKRVTYNIVTQHFKLLKLKPAKSECHVTIVSAASLPPSDQQSPAPFRSSTKSISIAALLEGGRRRPTSSMFERKQQQGPPPPIHQQSDDSLVRAPGPAVPKKPGHRRHNSLDNVLDQTQPTPGTVQVPPHSRHLGDLSCIQ